MNEKADGFGAQALADKINEMVREGNVRRIVVSNDSGRKILDVPVNAGVVAVLIAPMLSAAGAALALAGGWSIRVERREPEPSTEDIAEDG